MKQMKFPSSRVWLLSFLMAAFFLAPQISFAQTSGEQISWEDEEEDPAEDLSQYDEVFITVDGEEFDINQDDLEFEKNKVLDVQIRRLRPNSNIVVSLKKAGMKLSRQQYQANEKGELDLEIKTGKRKIKGQAKIYYSPGNNIRKEKNVKVKVI